MRIKEPYPMTSRLPYWTIAPKAVKRMMAINSYRVGSAIESSLRHLIWLRVSQINGCAYCVDLHTHEALRDGESLQRLNCLVVWAETPLFSDRERSALAWAEALTNVSETHAPDELYEAVRANFEDKELVDLTLMIASMNAWNRMAIGFRRQPSQRAQSAYRGC
jgi:AhpD family alkylhydroperoxidase